jgi:hypothetical protein
LVSSKEIAQRKETPVSISTINPISNHAKSIIEVQRSQSGLPFQDVLSIDTVQSHIANIPGRDRIFTPDLTLYTFLSQVISADQSCQAAVAQVVAHFATQEKEISANTAAYCNARSRLPEETLSALARESAEQLEQQAPKDWSWRGRDVQLIDGSCISMPDTSENQAVYPQPDTQKKGLVFQLRALLR